MREKIGEKTILVKGNVRARECQRLGSLHVSAREILLQSNNGSGSKRLIIARPGSGGFLKWALYHAQVTLKKPSAWQEQVIKTCSIRGWK